MGLAPGLLPGRRRPRRRPRLLRRRVAPRCRPSRASTPPASSQAAADGRIDVLVLLGADPLADFPDRDLAAPGPRRRRHGHRRRHLPHRLVQRRPTSCCRPPASPRGGHHHQHRGPGQRARPEGHAARHRPRRLDDRRRAGLPLGADLGSSRSTDLDEIGARRRPRRSTSTLDRSAADGIVVPLRSGRRARRPRRGRRPSTPPPPRPSTTATDADAADASRRRRRRRPSSTPAAPAPARRCHVAAPRPSRPSARRLPPAPRSPPASSTTTGTLRRQSPSLRRAARPAPSLRVTPSDFDRLGVDRRRPRVAGRSPTVDLCRVDDRAPTPACRRGRPRGRFNQPGSLAGASSTPARS